MMVFLAFGLVLSSCKKEPIEYHELSADFNNIPFIDEGQATEVIFTYKTRYTVYNRFLGTQQLEIRDIPYVHIESKLRFSDIEVVMNEVYHIDSNNIGVRSYSAVAGELVVQPISNGIIQGTFNFVMVNNEVDTDTVRIDNGKFKVTYTTIWYNP